MTEFNNFDFTVKELESTFSHLEDNDYQSFEESVTQAPRVFVADKVRSGFIANSFAMRLNPLGKLSYVVGETTTPSISSNDLLFFRHQVQLSICVYLQKKQIQSARK